jgi:hypothetical protein
MDSLKKELAGQYPQKEGFKIQASNVSAGLSSGDKWKKSLRAAILFAIVSGPFLYKLTNGLSQKFLGGKLELATQDGCPTPVGMVVHTVVFLILIRLLMK